MVTVSMLNSIMTVTVCINDTDGDNVCDELEVSGCSDDAACNYNADATDDDGSCILPQANFDCDGNCIATPIDWIGDQNGDGFISYDDNGNLYLAIESYPNTGIATLTLNGENYAMEYQDWGANAHWYWMISSDSPPMDYDWEVSVTNECNEGQALSGSFSTIPSVETLSVTTTVCCSSVAMNPGGWDPAAGPVASDNGDGTWTFTFDPAPTDDMEYLLVVDGVQEDLVAAGSASGDWSCTPITDYWSYANRLWTVGSGDVTNVYGTCGTECLQNFLLYISMLT